MFGKLNHLAITSDHYTLLGMFYRAAFGLKASGDTAREIGAISVGDGYLALSRSPAPGGAGGVGGRTGTPHDADPPPRGSQSGPRPFRHRSRGPRKSPCQGREEVP